MAKTTLKFDELKTVLERTADVTQSATILINSQLTELQALRKGTSAEDLPGALDEYINKLSVKTQELANAVAAGTPGAPNSDTPMSPPSDTQSGEAPVAESTEASSNG